MLSYARKAPGKRPWQLIGSEVITPNGDLLGEIEDVVLDKRTDAITEVVVGKLAHPADGELFHRIAWFDLEYSADEDAYVAPPPNRYATEPGGEDRYALS